MNEGSCPSIGTDDSMAEKGMRKPLILLKALKEFS